MITNNFLFNFAVSYSGGGYKRLYAYAKWFNENGGAYFIIHPSSKSLVTEFANNHFFVVHQSKLQRLFRDCDYLKEVVSEIGRPDVYYSYGIPIYYKLGRLNWFHLSNVLPLTSKGIALPIFDKLKLGYLGRRINANFKNTDVVSAESSYSLSLIKSKRPSKFLVSVNGSDDEIEFYHTAEKVKNKKIAVVLGTYRYKALEDSYTVFEMLRAKDNQLKLMIIGDDKKVPKNLHMNPNVILMGSLPRDKVVDYLRQSEFYISTTSIENSYNAASEGIFFAKESYISDIPPHRELVNGLDFEEVRIPNLNKTLLHLKKEEISPVNLKTWDNVITEMVEHFSNDRV